MSVIALIAAAGFTGARALARHNALTTAYAPAPEGMVFVPAGEFIEGSDDSQSIQPTRETFLPAFYIDKHEVTNADFKKFDPSHSYPAERAEYPVVKVGKDEAEAYAAWAGKRLPTSAEWEKAARGTDGRQYPWGNDFDSAHANIGGNDALVPVGSHPEGASPYGALDMSGNAWEWVADVHDDSGTGGTRRGIIRGGAYSYSAFQGACAYIGFESDDLTCNDLGFRCAMDAVPAN